MNHEVETNIYPVEIAMIKMANLNVKHVFFL